MADATEPQAGQAPDNSGPDTGTSQSAEAPAATAETPDVSAATASRTAGRSSAKTLGLRAVTLGAVVTAVISSIINPDFLSKAWHALAGDDSGATTATTTVALETKTNDRLSIVTKAPATWGQGNSPHNIFGPASPGDTLTTGADLGPNLSHAVSRLYVAASHDGVRRLGLRTADADAKLAATLHRDDWTKLSRCRLVGESPLPNEALAGVMREWAGCGGYGDATMWESWARTRDSSTLVYVQFNIRAADLDHDRAIEVLQSIVIDPARLSG